MKHFLVAALLISSTGSALAADIDVSVVIGQPGFYGRIDLGNAPKPQLIFPSPVIIQSAPVNVVVQPVYLHVPPGHEKNWRKHCHKYNACGQPVYFVRNNWYTNVYAPDYRSKHGGEEDGDEHKGKGKDKDKDHGRGHGKDNKEQRND